MGHYYSEMCCETCGELRCICPPMIPVHRCAYCGSPTITAWKVDERGVGCAVDVPCQCRQPEALRGATKSLLMIDDASHWPEKP